MKVYFNAPVSLMEINSGNTPAYIQMTDNKIINWGVHCNGKRLKTSQVSLNRGLINVL